jgi:hypothetical protein
MADHWEEFVTGRPGVTLGVNSQGEVTMTGHAPDRNVFDAPARFDGQGNPLSLVGCPNCGSGREWMGGLQIAALRNSGADPSAPCSRACELQIDHAQSLRPRAVR